MQKGQAMIVVLVFLALGAILGVAFFEFMGQGTILSGREAFQEKASQLAEAGINRALYELKASSSWNGISETPLGEGTYLVSVTNIDASNKRIESTGFIPNSSSPRAKRTIRATITFSPGAGAFKFGAQAGTGGVILASNATVKGNVYSNGNISCDSNAKITGDGFAVGTINPSNCPQGQSQSGVQPKPLPEFDRDYWIEAANQNPSPGCPTSGSLTFSSGQSSLGPCQINGNLTLDGNVKLIITGPLYITGNFTMDSNSELKLDDSFGKNSTVILVDGKVSLESNTQIKRAQKTSILRPNGNYQTQWSVTGASSNWNALDDNVTQPQAGDTNDYIFSNVDGQADEFELTTASDVSTTSEIVVWAYARTTGNDQLGIDLVVGGSSQGQQNKSLSNSFSWTNATFTISTGQSQIDSLRARLIQVKSGAQDSVEVATLYATVRYLVSGGGYIMVASATTTEPAIALNSNNAGGLFYALNGTVRVDSNVDVVSLTGQKILLLSNAEIFYDTGLPDSAFTSGPGGGWVLKEGSWYIIE